jgi:hypothetical protein
LMIRWNLIAHFIHLCSHCSPTIKIFNFFMHNFCTLKILFYFYFNVSV